jgi:hypothetical protein
MGHIYVLRKRSKTTKLFGNTQLRVASHTESTINNILKHHTQTDKYNNSSIYQMKFLDCPLKYIGQTGRTFSVRYKEHIYAVRSNISNCKIFKSYIKHGICIWHMSDAMDVVRTGQDRKEWQIFKPLRKVSHL